MIILSQKEAKIKNDASFNDGTGIADDKILNRHIADSALAGLIEIGYAQSTGSFSSTTTPAYVDVTNLTITVTVPAGRTLKVTAGCRSMYCTGAGGYIDMSIREGSTVLNSTTSQVGGGEQGHVAIARLTPSTGSHTYKVSIKQTAAGTMGVVADATMPSFIMAELI